jgi:predicted N-acetyltransferase YhbS
MSTLIFTISPETPPDSTVIDKLHDRAFGPGRFTRTASRMRETSMDDQRLSFVAKVGTLLVGSIRQTPVKIDALSGLLLGPLTVEPAFEGKGIGRALMKHSIETAAILGYKLIILVGDAPYYAKAGFKQVPMGKITLSGPVDPARLLYLELSEGVIAEIKNGQVEA